MIIHILDRDFLVLYTVKGRTRDYNSISAGT